MLAITTPRRTRTVSMKPVALGDFARNLSARADFAFDQLTDIIFALFGKNTAGSTYALVRISKPGVWTTPRRSDVAGT